MYGLALAWPLPNERNQWTILNVNTLDTDGMIIMVDYILLLYAQKINSTHLDTLQIMKCIIQKSVWLLLKI